MEKSEEHESDGESNCNWCSWYSYQMIQGLEDLQIIDHSNYSIIKIG